MNFVIVATKSYVIIFVISFQQVLASPANPPLLQDLPLSSLPWAPHRDLLLLPSTPASPRGSQELEAGQDGNPKDRALPHSQSPAPATPPCLTHRPRTDPTTMSASLQWEGARPAQGAKHRLAWVSRRCGIRFDVMMQMLWSGLYSFRFCRHDIVYIHYHNSSKVETLTRIIHLNGHDSVASYSLKIQQLIVLQNPNIPKIYVFTKKSSLLLLYSL